MICSPDSWWKSASSSPTSWASKSIAWPSPFLGSITARRHFPWVFPRSTSNPFHLHHIILFILIYPEIYGDTCLQMLRNQFLKKTIVLGERTWLLFKDQWTAGLCFNLCSNLCSKLSNQWFPVRATCTITHLCPVLCQAGYLSAIRVFVCHICDHARSIFSLFLISYLPPTCTFLYCSSTEQPSQATMLSPFQWKS